MKNHTGITLGLTAALFFAQPGSSIAGSSKQLAECASESSLFVRVGCYSEIAAAEGEPDICDQIKEHYLGYAGCISQVAVSTQDATICDSISKDHPKALCIIKVGAVSGDYSHCASIGSASWRSACEEKGAQTGAAN